MKISLFDERFGQVESRITDFSHIPKFHISPPFGGYINDVNAFFKYKDTYHLFFQYGYYANDSGIKSWMHCTSQDLVRWKYQGTPILPDSPFDDKGAWSGNVFFYEEKPIIVYYAYSHGICYAYPEDCSDSELKRWKKYQGNPVIKMPTEGNGYAVYDASNVFVHGGKYCLLTGNKDVKTGRPANYVFVSDDLKSWECKGIFFSPDELEDREDLACPNLTEIENGLYLYTVSSHLSGVLYYVGKIKDFKFELISSGRFNYHSGNEMGQSVFKDGNELVYKSWLTVRLKDELLLNRGWSGALTLPKALKINSDGELEVYPHKNVFNYFEKDYEEVISLKNGEFLLPYRANSFMLRLKIDGDGKCGVKVGVGDGEYTSIYINFDEGKLILDHENSSKEHPLCNKFMFEFRDYEYKSTVECSIEKGLKSTEMTIFFDKCVIEVFCEGKSIGKTVLPKPSSDKIVLFTDSSAVFGVEISKIKEML